MLVDFNKGNGLVPVIIQHYASLQVLMLGYMNKEAYQQTLATQKVCFFSRTKNRLWVKGETSGNYLYTKEIKQDCDNDALLILVNPVNVTCHTGSFSCFSNKVSKGFVYELEQTVEQRINSEDAKSYTYNLYKKGINKVAQKLGEEAVELVIEAKDNNQQLLKNEAADLLFHFLILLKAKGVSFEEVEEVLMKRSK
jgi:phosphoribosyl-ATP pyrophosphohydrolase/phosphoribosyl-AMP cyclohydrolase